MPSPESVYNCTSSIYHNLKSFEADFSLSVKFGILKGTLHGEFKMCSPDHFAGKVKGPFGVTFAELVTDEDSFELTLQGGKVITGLKDTLDLAALTGFPVPTAEPGVLLAPFAQPAKSLKQIVLFNVLNDSAWVVEIRESESSRKLTIDPKLPAVIQEQWINENGEEVLKKIYGDFNRIGGQLVPQVISIIIKSDKPLQAQLRYESMRINPVWKENPFQFKTPSGV